jgi:hypothetical protein
MACKDCKKRANFKINLMFVLGIELLITSIYGHVQLFKLIIDWVSPLF